MNKTKIEWCDYTLNPVKGLCPMACSYCYARRMYKRYKWDEAIRFDAGIMEQPGAISKPSRIFVGSTMELFGPWVNPQWRDTIIKWAAHWSEHTFIFLTKCPQNLPKEWPDNCWVGVSATDATMAEYAGYHLERIQAKVKFVSFEPLLYEIPGCFADWLAKDGYAGINWLIIGAQTPYNVKTAPKVDWVREIALAATKAHIPIFIKENLRQHLPNRMPFWDVVSWRENGITMAENRLRQEFPEFVPVLRPSEGK